MISISTQEPDRIYNTPYITAWVSPTWDGVPVYVPNLQPMTATQSVFPSISEASFLWLCGDILYPNVGSFATYTPLQLAGAYVEIRAYSEYGSEVVWTGVFAAESNMVTGIAQGNQTLVAYGIEYLLDTCGRIDGAWVDDPPGWVSSPIPFNRAAYRGASVLGNRSMLRNEDGGYRFSKDGASWTNLDILDYALRHHLYTPYSITLDGQYDVLDSIVEIHDFDGASIKECINTLISYRRGVGAYMRVNGIGSSPRLRVFSLLTEEINLGDYVIPANNQRVYLNTISPFSHATITESTAKQFTDIMVTGEPIKVALTCYFPSGEEALDATRALLEPCWTSEEEVAYESATDTERAEKKFDHVFTRFKVMDSWDRAGASPLVPGDGTVDIDGAGAYFNAFHSFERFLPWEEPYQSWSDRAEKNFDVPFGVVLVGEKYYMMHKLGEVNEEELEFKGGSISLSVADNTLGLSIGASPNHVMAKNHWDAEAEESRTEPVLDYEKTAYTVCLTTDQALRILAKVSSQPGVNKILYLKSPGAEYWYAKADTIYDVVDGDVVYFEQAHPTRVIRDDSDRIKNKAFLAAAWYSTPRTTIVFTVDKLVRLYEPGSMVVSTNDIFGQRLVGTPVTERSWNFSTQTCDMKTGYIEIDMSEPTARRAFSRRKGGRR